VTLPLAAVTVANGIRLTRLGLGGAPLGGLFAAVTADDAAATLQLAWQSGVRYFDTAPLYGSGLAEERLGRFLAGVPRDTVTVSTKVGRLLLPDPGARADTGYHGHPLKPSFDFSRDGVRRSLEDSLGRLGITYADIVFLHDPDDHWRQAVEQAYPALAELRSAGVVRSIGVGMNQAPMLARFVRETDIDCVLLAGRYTLLDTEAGHDLLPLCAERNVPVIAAGVFNSGILAYADPAANYDYTTAPAAVVAQAQLIQRTCARRGVPLGAAAIQFPLRHPAVASVLIGARSPAELRADLAWYHHDIPPSTWSAITTAIPPVSSGPH
jgi:D-threo-aldose 1-dehydrogenase